MDRLDAVLAAHDEEEDRTISLFRRRFEMLWTLAEANLVLWLMQNLVVRNGVVMPSGSNMRLVQSLPAKLDQLVFNGALGEAFEPINQWYRDQRAYTDRLIAAAGLSAPKLDTTADSFLAQLRSANNKRFVQSVVTAAELAALHGQIAVGAPLDELIAAVKDQLAPTPAKLKTLAATAIESYSRAVTDLSYREIEQQNGPQRYRYMGPPAGDPRIRPFCERLMALVAQGTTWRRAEIDAMDNGQLPNVFVTCGGYNCRHIWLMVF